MFQLLLIFRNLRPFLRKLRLPVRGTFITVLRPNLRRLNRKNLQISQTSFCEAAAPRVHVLGVVRWFLSPNQTLIYGTQVNRANPAVCNATDTGRAIRFFWFRPRSPALSIWNVISKQSSPAPSPHATPPVHRCTATQPALPEKMCIQRRQPISEQQREQLGHSPTHVLRKQPFPLH